MAPEQLEPANEMTSIDFLYFTTLVQMTSMMYSHLNTHCP